ncbi:MAG: hypothetical protein FRX49_02360 [Trebouxia sp. A1-2]|nr:MAG: hypothetical protein FRX49_02360 [Trebouxia sp. A1-2]
MYYTGLSRIKPNMNSTIFHLAYSLMAAKSGSTGILLDSHATVKAPHRGKIQELRSAISIDGRHPNHITIVGDRQSPLRHLLGGSCPADCLARSVEGNEKCVAFCGNFISTKLGQTKVTLVSAAFTDKPMGECLGLWEGNAERRVYRAKGV